MLIIGTGLSGLIGSRIQELLSNEFEFVDFSLESGVNILDFEKLETAFEENKKAEVVIHLAAFTDVSKAWGENGDRNGLCFRLNVLGTRNIASLCQRFNKYLIHISTDYVFSGEKPVGSLYTEEDKPEPIEWYGQTKLWAEEEVKKSGCNQVILRPAFPFKAAPSSFEKETEAGFKLDLVRKIIKKLKAGEKLKMFSDQVITPTFIDDFAGAVEKIIKERPTGVYHGVGSSPLSPFEIALKVAEVFSLDKNKIKEIRLEDLGRDQRPRQKNLGLSNKKLENELGIKMRTFEEALEIISKQISLASKD